jgi:hypothetical protein
MKSKRNELKIPDCILYGHYCELHANELKRMIRRPAWRRLYGHSLSLMINNRMKKRALSDSLKFEGF